MVPAVIWTVRYINADDIVSVMLFSRRSRSDARCERCGCVAPCLHMSPADCKLTLPAEVLMWNVTTFKFHSTLNSKNRLLVLLEEWKSSASGSTLVLVFVHFGFESESVLCWRAKNEAPIHGWEKFDWCSNLMKIDDYWVCVSQTFFCMWKRKKEKKYM